MSKFMSHELPGGGGSKPTKDELKAALAALKVSRHILIKPLPDSFAEALNMERLGIPAEAFVSAIQKLKIPSSHALEIFDIPKSTAAHKVKTGGRFEGADVLAYIRLKKLLSLAETIVSNSLHPDAKDFDSGKWLGEWIETPQPALGGLKPSELLDTETGGQRVYQLLAALESGSYQ